MDYQDRGYRGDKGLIMDTYVRHQQDWIVPRRVMCGFFWTGIILLFTGIILLVTSKHKGAVYQSWGAVLLGLGFCLLLICLILCIHAYCVITVSDQELEQQASQPPVRRHALPPPGYTLANGRKPLPAMEPGDIVARSGMPTDGEPAVAEMKYMENPEPKRAVLTSIDESDEDRPSTSNSPRANGRTDTLPPHQRANGGSRLVTQQSDSLENSCTCDIQLADKRKSGLTKALDEVLDDIGETTEKKDHVRFSLNESPEDVVDFDFKERTSKISPSRSKRLSLKEYEEELGKSYRSFNEDVDRSFDKDLNVKSSDNKGRSDSADTLDSATMQTANSSPTKSHDGLIMIHPSHSESIRGERPPPQLERQQGLYKGGGGGSDTPLDMDIEAPDTNGPPRYEDVERTPHTAAYDQEKTDSISAQHDVVHPLSGAAASTDQPSSASIPPPHRPEPRMTSIGVQYSPPVTPQVSPPTTRRSSQQHRIVKPKAQRPMAATAASSEFQDSRQQSMQHRPHHHHSDHHSKHYSAQDTAHQHSHHHHHQPHHSQLLLKGITSRPPTAPQSSNSRALSGGPQGGRAQPVSRPPRLWVQGGSQEQRAAAQQATSSGAEAPATVDIADVDLSNITLYDNVQYNPYVAADVARAGAAKKEVQHFHF